MANETGSSGSGREPGGEDRNPRTERRQPIGGGKISREEETGGRVGGEGDLTQQSDVDTNGGAPSRQTSTAEDETGQL